MRQKTSCTALEVTESQFLDEDEKFEWACGKWEACKSSQKPDRVHKNNWKLDEKWFSFDSGEHQEQETQVTEKMQRVGTDLAGTSTMLAIDEPKGKLKAPCERHKAARARVCSLASRLARTLSSSEASLPGLKRKVSPETYKKLRTGVLAVRDVRDHVLDELEDLKVLPEDPQAQEQSIEGLLALQRTLQEHQDALVEAWKVQKEPIVKKDVEMEAPGDDGAGSLQ